MAAARTTTDRAGKRRPTVFRYRRKDGQGKVVSYSVRNARLERSDDWERVTEAQYAKLATDAKASTGEG